MPKVFASHMLAEQSATWQLCGSRPSRRFHSATLLRWSVGSHVFILAGTGLTIDDVKVAVSKRLV
jgi:hypothetical protein